ncbi:unnamed protein product, partial [marine sediment metagenome]
YIFPALEQIGYIQMERAQKPFCLSRILNSTGFSLDESDPVEVSTNLELYEAYWNIWGRFL